jgi:exodeoxyribonuclease V gamma subunit
LPPEAFPVPEPLSLHALRQLLRQPVEVFFKARLGVVLSELDEAGEDTEPFALDGLDKYLAGQSVLEAADPVQALAELPLRGLLPLAAFGQRDLHELQGRVAVVQERLAPWAERYPQALPAQPIDLVVDGLRLQDSLGGLFGSADAPAPAEGGDSLWRGPCLQRVMRSGAVLQGKGKEQGARVEVVAAVWVNHLAGCAQGLALTSTVLGLDGQIVLRPLAPAQALAVLSGLVQVYRAAWAQPLPVAALSAWAYDQALRRGKDEAQAHELARVAYEGDYQRAGEAARSPYLQRCFQGYAELQAELPHWAEALYGELARHLHLGPLGDPA